jgi:hypothetical protein
VFSKVLSISGREDFTSTSRSSEFGSTAWKAAMLHFLSRWDESRATACRRSGIAAATASVLAAAAVTLLLATPTRAQGLSGSTIAARQEEGGTHAALGRLFAIAASDIDADDDATAAPLRTEGQIPVQGAHAAYALRSSTSPHHVEPFSQDRGVIIAAALAWAQTDAGRFALAHFQQIWGYPLGKVIFTAVPRPSGMWRDQEVIFGSNTAPFPVVAESGGAVQMDFIVFLNPIDYAPDGVLSLAVSGAKFHHTIASLVFTELSVLSGLSHDAARQIYPTIPYNKVLENSLTLFVLARAAGAQSLTLSGAADEKLMIPQLTDPAFDRVVADDASPIPSGIDFANLTFQEAHAAHPALPFPMDDGAPVERANHWGVADPNGPWAGLPIAHDQDEYETGIRLLRQQGRQLVPGFMIRLIAAEAADYPSSGE